MLRKLIPVPTISFYCRCILTRCSISIYLLYLFLATACSAPFAETMDVEIDWSPESTLFNKGSLTTTKFVRIGDKVIFQCPPNLFLSIYRVTKQSMLNCDLSHANDTLVGFCRPNSGRFTFVVRDFSLLPNAPIFQPNEDYYFTSTSNGTENGLENKFGGFCRSHDMRLRLKVASRNSSRENFRPADKLNKILPDESSNFRNHVKSSQSSSENDSRLNSLTTRHIAHSQTRTEQGKAAEGFPAVVTFQDNDRDVKILVETYDELKEKLDEYLIRRGNTPIGGVRVEPMNPPRPSEINRKLLPEYEISTQNNGASGRKKEEESIEHIITIGPEAASLLKGKMLRPDEKDYEIGYDLENGSSNLYLTYGFWLCVVANLAVLLLSRTALDQIY